MQIKLWSGFSKRNNSTKIPSGSAIVADVKIKSNTSVLNPVFLIDGIDLNVDYCQWNNRYYFINDIILGNNNIYELHCSTDFLATFKSQILSTSCNILYATGSTKNIVDKRIPVTGGVTITSTVQNPGFTIINNGNPTAIIGVTGKGSFGAYRLKFADDMKSLLDGVDSFTASTFLSTNDILKQWFYGGSAADNLKSAFALPIVESSGLGAESDIYLGNYPCKSGDRYIKGYPIEIPVMIKTSTLEIPWHHSGWLRNTPYSSVYVYLPLIGMISIPTSDIVGEESFKITYSINQTSGDIAVQIKGTDSSRILCTASGNCALPTAFGSVGIDTNKMTTAVVTGVGALVAGVSALATGGASIPVALGIAGGLATSAASTIEALGGTASGSGGLGGGATHGLDTQMHCYVVSRDLTDTPTHFNPIMGKPYFGVSTPGAFTGFVMTEGFRLNASCLDADRTAVDNLMNSGVYIE